jgi:bacterioferritin
MADDKSAIIEELKTAYRMELETVMNYIANSVNLDGVRAEEIKKSLAADVTEELGHAQTLARRIKTMGGQVPGSLNLAWDQRQLQPPGDTTDVVTVIRGVIEAENSAVSQYEKIVKMSDGVDYVTQDLAIDLMGDEEEHRREFVGFLKEYSK